jgi:TetR/AcrR family transcriptional repressor of nem operon
MARPKEFDREQALDAAKHVFWRKGYEGVSTEDLRLSMGIGRQSFYDTFSSKRELYLEALERYVTDTTGALIRQITASRSPLAGIRAVLESIARESDEQRALGCMGLASVCAFGPNDVDVVEVRATAGKALQHALEEALTRARDAGELHEDLDIKSAAYFIQGTLTGLRMMAKSDTPPKMLRAMVTHAMQGISEHERQPGSKPRGNPPRSERQAR